jgi:helix-turn-helix, Psq domain
MESLTPESRVILALQAIQDNKNLSIQAAAKIYNMPATTIHRRRDGHTARCSTRPNSMNLTKSEEDAIIQYIIELSTRAFPPRISGVEEMAN